MMINTRNSSLWGKITVLVVICCCVLPAQAKYGGGTGEPNDPYLIFDANQMNAIGADSNDWDKHFKLMADIDLSGFTGAEFNIIGTGYFECPPLGLCYLVSTPFTGTFDGNDHEILNFTYSYTGIYIIGLFGVVDGENAEIKNLRLIEPNVAVQAHAGSLVGYLVNGTITDCYVEGGSITGDRVLGGLIGSTGSTTQISNCHATGNILGQNDIGGLVGSNYGTVSECYSVVSVIGDAHIGGLIGYNSGSISRCYSTGSISATGYVGGLVGENRGQISNCYSLASVSGSRESVGGLVGTNSRTLWNCYSAGSVSPGGGLVGRGGGAFGSYWDTETSGQMTSAGGKGKTTAQMQMASTFIGWGGCGEPLWTIDEGNDFPRLSWENKPGELLSAQLSDFTTGAGTENDPYLIYSADQLNMIGLFPCQWNRHFRLMADIDLANFTGTSFNIIGYHVYSYSEPFTGVFDGNGHTISNFTYSSKEKNVGLFGCVTGEIKDLGLIHSSVYAGTSIYVGSLVGRLENGIITGCYAEGGSVLGRKLVGGLVGYNYDGTISNCYTTASVSSTDDDYVGGLVGWNKGEVFECCFSGNVVGRRHVGGLVGANDGTISGCCSFGGVLSRSYAGGLAGSNGCAIYNSYSEAIVTAASSYAIAGGLVGDNQQWGLIFKCYSIGCVSGGGKVGGLVGYNGGVGLIAASFWDVQTSGQTTSAGGTGKTTAEMQTESTFTDAGWDFVGETIKGTDDIWRLCVDGTSYPQLNWQFPLGDFLCPDGVDMIDMEHLALHWLDTGCDETNDYCDWAEISNDSTVDFTDFAILAGNWLAGR